MTADLSILLSLRTAGALEKLNQFTSNASSSLRNLAMTVAGAYVGISGLIKVKDGIVDAINLQEAVGRLRRETGLAIPTLSAFKEGGEEVGTEFSEMSTSLGKFSQNFYEAMTVGGSAAQTFRTMGVELRNLDGSARDINDVMAETVRWFSAQEAGAQKSKFATELFGKSGRDLIPVLDGVQSRIDETRAGGGLFSEGSVRQATEFNRRLREIGDRFEEIFAKIAYRLIPVMNDLLNQIDRIDFGKIGDSLAGTVAAVGQAFRDGTVSDLVGDALKLGVDTFLAYLPSALERMGRMFLKAFETPLVWLQARMEFIFQQSEFAAQDPAGHQKMLDEIAEARKKADAATPNFGKIFASPQESEAMDAAWAEYFKKKDEIETKFFKESFQKVLADRKEEGLKFDLGTGEFGLGDITEDANRRAAEAAEKVRASWSEFEGKIASLVARAPRPPETPPAKPSAFFPGPSQEAIKDLQQYRQLTEEIYKINREVISKDPFRSQVEQARALLPLLQRQIELVEGQAAAALEAYNTATEDAKKEDALRQLVKLTGDYNDLLREQVELQSRTSFSSQFRIALTEIKDQWGSWAQQAAGTFKTVFNTSVQSISQGITGLIMKTTSWRDALMQIGTTILTSIVSSIVEVGVRWVATQIMMMLFGKAMAAASTAALVPIAAAQSAIWSAPATLATIATFGGAATMAPPLIMAAQGITLASAVAREHGGPVESGVPYIVGERRAELFVPRTAGTIMPSVPRAMPQGFAGNSEPRRVDQTIVVVFDKRAAQREARKNAGAIIVEGFDGNRARHGFNT
jgi:hypothetical protein